MQSSTDKRPVFDLTGRLSFARGWPARLLVVLALAGAGRGLAGERGLDQTSQPASAQAGAPTTAPDVGVRVFQPGVMIDWRTPAVIADARVALREGPLEFLACFAGKEHESVLLFTGRAEHIYMALGLIGVEPGKPATYDAETRKNIPATGGLVDIELRWSVGGETHTAPAYDWLREIEYLRTPIDRPWIFAGSRRLPDGTFGAQRTGEGIAIVSMPDALLACSRSHTSRDADLWAIANHDAIPPLDTPVQIVMRPAQPREREFALDARGAAWVDGRYATLPDLVDVVRLQRRLKPEAVIRIGCRATLWADVERVRGTLRLAGLDPDALKFERFDNPE